MIFKPLRKSIFQQTYTFIAIIWHVLLDTVKVYNENIISVCFVFCIVNFVTFTNSLSLLYIIKGWKIEKAYKVDHKKLRKNYIKSKSKTSKVKPVNFI